MNARTAPGRGRPDPAAAAGRPSPPEPLVPPVPPAPPPPSARCTCGGAASPGPLAPAPASRFALLSASDRQSEPSGPTLLFATFSFADRFLAGRASEVARLAAARITTD